MSMRNPFKIISGLGSSRDGTMHFWYINLTAIANIPLTIFLVWFVISAAGKNQAEMMEMFSSPLIMAMMLLTIISFVWHMRLGMQAVIEDYITSEGRKITAILLNYFFSASVAIIGIVSVLMLGLGG